MGELKGLALHLRYVGALCERAIALGWHSGRISFPNVDRYPFQSEVKALLRDTDEGATPQLATALAHIEGLRAAIASERQQRDEAAAQGQSPPPSHWQDLAELSSRFGLNELAIEILFIVAAPRLWGELSRLYGIITNDPARPLCDELFVCQLLDVPLTERWRVARELSPEGPLLRHGLLTAQGGERPFAALLVDPFVAAWLQGDREYSLIPEGQLELQLPERPAEELALPPNLLANLLREIENHPKSTPLRLVLRGRLGSGRRALLAALAVKLGYKLGSISLSLLCQDKANLQQRLRGLLRQAALRGWLPCIDGDHPAVSSDVELLECVREVTRRYPGPLFVRCGLESPAILAPGYLAFELPPLGETQRLELFRGTLREYGLPITPAETLAAKYRVGPGVIRRVVSQVAQAPREGLGNGLTNGLTNGRRERLLLSRLEAALRQHRSSQIGSLAALVTRKVTWQQVVLPDDILDSIQEFIGRIRFRRKVYDTWGMDSVMTSSRGFTALFQGGAGTGKSMVGGLIAQELGYDLYRVDVSRILSRWIGETEQNLARLFDAAEDGQAIILFDEADALFTKRTEVRSSVDRYANVQVNYLLQRLDAFEGIAILTTNQGTAIDSAFKRRLSMRLTFPFPDEQLRQDLWRVHLPASLPVTEPLDLRRLAVAYELSGGYIRNAVLRAAFLAAQDGRDVSQAHLERAVRLEYREAGKLYDGGVLE